MKNPVTIFIYSQHRWISNCFKYLKNPISSLFFKAGILKTYNVKVKNTNYEIRIRNKNSLNRIMFVLPGIQEELFESFFDYIKDLENDVEQVSIDGIKYINVFNSEFEKTHPYNYAIHIDEFFTGDEWDMISYSGRHIIDIGGNVGDTALYFAKEGAEVISFEPVRHLYELAEENVQINPQYKDKITLVNKGVGGSKGTLTFSDVSVNGYVEGNQYEMEIISISDLLNDYDFTPDILKMDCEGCEFEVISKHDLTMFNDIIFEHHAQMVNKDHRTLIDILENQGFKTNIYPCNASDSNIEEMGIIHAFK